MISNSSIPNREMSAADYEQLFNSCVDAVCVIDVDTYKITWMNDQFRQKYNYHSNNEQPGCYSVLYGYDRPCPDNLLDCPAKRPESFKRDRPYSIDNIHIGPDGNEHYIETYVRPIYDRSGRMSRLAYIARNITNYLTDHSLHQPLDLARVVSEDKQDWDRQILPSESGERKNNHNGKKVEFSREMVASLAHQWKQPLMALGLLVDDLEENPDDFEDEGERVLLFAEFRKLIGFMSSTVEDFTNFARPMSRKEFNVLESLQNGIEPISGSIMRNAINLSVRNHIGQSREYKLSEFLQEKSFPDIYTRGYAGEFRHACLNIVNNAIKALTHNDIVDAEIMVELKEYNDDWIEIDIQDNGPGLPEQFIDHLFNLYFSTGQKSTGLGLYISRMIIEERMGGRIQAMNQQNGALFRIQLPAIKRPF